MKAEKILFITQEITPFVPESQIATASHSLLQAIQDKVKEIRIFTPLWGTINTRRNNLHEVIRLSGMNLIIDDTDHPLIIKVASLQSARMQVYFIENDDYFHNRLMTKDENGVEYSDNDERTIFFNLGVIEAVKKQRWCPEIIHCNGWMSALVPMYIRNAYKDEPSFRDSKIIVSLFDDEFEGSLAEGFKSKLLCKEMHEDAIAEIGTPATHNELIKLAIRNSDGIIVNGDNIPAEFIEYAQALGKAILPKQTPEEFPEACYAFYNTILGEQ
ncbi:MAG: glycogen/starch synthase [Bacteroidaceae bacterium]|nr:glycogen/starch synthase [Bacteroidaceae bacterium]